jgi:hypothetical protein
MEHCNICNINILKKNFKRHELSQKHSDNLQNYVPENIIDTDINEPDLQEPILPIMYKPKKEKKNKRKRKFEQLKREVLSEFDTLERNHEDISPQEIKKEFKKVFTNIKTNKRNFETTYFENDEYKVISNRYIPILARDSHSFFSLQFYAKKY